MYSRWRVFRHTLKTVSILPSRLYVRGNHVEVWNVVAGDACIVISQHGPPSTGVAKSKAAVLLVLKLVRLKSATLTLKFERDSG